MAETLGTGKAVSLTTMQEKARRRWHVIAIGYVRFQDLHCSHTILSKLIVT